MSMFTSWHKIEQNFEVFRFMCGIMDDPSPAINHMCEKFTTYCLGESFYSLFTSTFKGEI